MEKQAKKEKLFYLDFVRVFSMIVIISYHFSVYFKDNKLCFTNFWTRNGTGTLGVTLFFMVSGASLMYNYGDHINLKEYYKKRLLKIFPMFWIAYTISFLLNFIYYKGFFYELPIYKLGITIIGMDGYLSDYINTWYLLGEWFLGAIIIIYLIFPILKKIIQEYPKTYLIILFSLYLLVLLNYNFKIAPTKNIIVSIFSFSLGMYYLKYIKQIKWYYVLLVFAFLTALQFINVSQPSHITLIYTIIGYSMFIVLSFVGSKINTLWFKEIIIHISKYSYAIFLVHNRILYRIGEYFSDAVLDKYGIIVVYGISITLIYVIARLIYNLNTKIIRCFKTIK